MEFASDNSGVIGHRIPCAGLHRQACPGPIPVKLRLLMAKGITVTLDDARELSVAGDNFRLHLAMQIGSKCH
jgi:hypothetical protein